MFFSHFRIILLIRDLQISDAFAKIRGVSYLRDHQLPCPRSEGWGRGARPNNTLYSFTLIHRTTQNKWQEHESKSSLAVSCVPTKSQSLSFNVIVAITQTVRFITFISWWQKQTRMVFCHRRVHPYCADFMSTFQQGMLSSELIMLSIYKYLSTVYGK